MTAKIITTIKGTARPLNRLFSVAMLVLFSGELRANTPFLVHSVAELEARLSKLIPGDVVVLADGHYETKRRLRLEGVKGTAEAPITIRAEHVGKASIEGAFGFRVRDCEYVSIQGLVLAHDSDEPSMSLENCRYFEIARNIFHLTERPTPRRHEHWIYVIGAKSEFNHIHHNLMEKKANIGTMIFLRGDDTMLVCSKHDQIDHNQFRDVVNVSGENGHETLRIGGNDLGASGQSSFALIENNLFERCSGDEEIISLKSSDNIVRSNTIINSRGAICLRLGNRDSIYGNFVVATDGGEGRGGVKIYGCNHRVYGNYFYGLTGTTHEAPLALIPGTLDTPTTDRIGKAYIDMTSVPATAAWIAFNTWIDCAPLYFGKAKKDPERIYTPKECVFENNLIVLTKPRPKSLLLLGELRGISAHDNIGFAAGAPLVTPWEKWFLNKDPELKMDQNQPEIWRLSESSPARSAASGVNAEEIQDVFGRLCKSRHDIGAEEFLPNVPIRGLLTDRQVGPDAP